MSQISYFRRIRETTKPEAGNININLFKKRKGRNVEG